MLCATLLKRLDPVFQLLSHMYVFACQARAVEDAMLLDEALEIVPTFSLPSSIPQAPTAGCSSFFQPAAFLCVVASPALSCQTKELTSLVLATNRCDRRPVCRKGQNIERSGRLPIIRKAKEKLSLVSPLQHRK